MRLVDLFCRSAWRSRRSNSRADCASCSATAARHTSCGAFVGTPNSSARSTTAASSVGWWHGEVHAAEGLLRPQHARLAQRAVDVEVAPRRARPQRSAHGSSPPRKTHESSSAAFWYCHVIAWNLTRRAPAPTARLQVHTGDKAQGTCPSASRDRLAARGSWPPVRAPRQSSSRAGSSEADRRVLVSDGEARRGG